jgi:hypothetical protein
MFVRRTRSIVPAKEATEKIAPSSVPDGTEIFFETSVQREGIKATARMVDGEFVVEAGSTARREWIGAVTHNYRLLYEELVKTGVLVEENGKRRFAQSYAFSSPSAAGAMVAGRSFDGPKSWTVRGTGETYREWEQRRLGA